MKTYLALNRLTFYFQRTEKAFKALFGILYLTNDINSAQQFYANHYLSESLKIAYNPQCSLSINSSPPPPLSESIFFHGLDISTSLLI